VTFTLLYTYDLAGNRIKTDGTFAWTNLPPALSTVSYNANNQQTTFGVDTLTYDLNGNLTSVTDGSDTTTYTWNVRNQLTNISGPSFAASFTYDSFGRRTGRTVQSVTTNYVYDGLNPVQEKDGSTVTANLLTGLNLDEFFTRTDGVGSRALLTDALGSTIALADNTGTPQTQYTYEPFGFTTQTGAASTNSYKYAGREDDGSGLYYYRARYYHPRLQRFISEDPIGFSAGDMNIYSYVFNRPTRYTDPQGLEVRLCCRPAQIFGGLVDHCWITTNTISAGMGANPNILPGAQSDSIGTPVQIIDHSNDSPVQCTTQNNVNEPCVNSQLQIGKSLGIFFPPFNQCQSFAYGTINMCRTGPQIIP
jgi:RHS repeat-associated protein